MSTSQALETLTGLEGIGPWSAGLVLLRGLGRNDVFPPGDIGAARSLTTLMRRGAGTPFNDVIERFADHRGYLYFCALGGSLLAKGLIHAAPTFHGCLGSCAG
jgi:DNA-3-methyladenine glycosylase II